MHALVNSNHVCRCTKGAIARSEAYPEFILWNSPLAFTNPFSENNNRAGRANIRPLSALRCASFLFDLLLCVENAVEMEIV